MISKNSSKTLRKAAVTSKSQAAEVLRLKDELRLKDIELKIYRELGEAVIKRRDIGKILGRLMSYTMKAFQTDTGTLYLVDELRGELAFEIVKGPMARKLKGMRVALGKGIVGRVASTGKPYVSTDLRHDKAWLGIKDDKSQKTMMAVPLKEKGRVIGVIAVINKAGGEPFTATDFKIFASLANHFSIIMERRGIFEELDVRVKQSAALHKVGSLLVSTLDERLVRERAMEAITSLIDAETGSLLMVDKDKKELFFEVALGEKGAKVKDVRLKIGEGIAGWVARYGRALVVNDVKKDKRFQARVDKRSQFSTRSVLCVPVKIKGKTIGVLQAINKKTGDFSDDDKEFFDLFSNQVAIALDNARLYKEIRETFYSTSEALAEAIEKRDPYTGGHTKRVLGYSVAVARRLGMGFEEVESLKLSAMLHDIGKIGIDDAILRKNAALDDDEVGVMKKHPRFGVEILGHVPQLKEVVPGIYLHHERIDGKGYPNGVKSGKIPLMARIIAVADTYDAMTTTRPYRKGLEPEVAIRELKRCAGTQFDKRVVRAFVEAYKNGDISGQDS